MTHLSPLRCSHTLLMAALCAVSFSSWALSPEEPLAMRYEQAALSQSPSAAQQQGVSPRSASERLTSNCTLHVTRIDDRRASPYVANATFSLSMLGTPLGMQSLRGDDGRGWAAGGLNALSRHGFRVQTGDVATPAPRQAALEVTLRLAHAWNAGYSLVSNVVLQARYTTQGGDAQRQYNGVGTRTNWSGSNSEYLTVLNLGLDDALADLARDAAMLCAGQPLPPQPGLDALSAAAK